MHCGEEKEDIGFTVARFSHSLWRDSFTVVRFTVVRRKRTGKARGRRSLDKAGKRKKGAHLCDVGHEVVGGAGRVLADPSTACHRGDTKHTSDKGCQWWWRRRVVEAAQQAPSPHTHGFPPYLNLCGCLHLRHTFTPKTMRPTDGPGVCADGVEVAQHHHLDVAAIGALAVVLQELLLSQSRTMKSKRVPVQSSETRLEGSCKTLA